jgi:hypothetical protein
MVDKHASCSECEQAKKMIHEWIGKQGHDRCWYYPDLFKKLASVFKISMKVEPQLPPRSEFEEGCRKYQAEQYGDK